MKSNRTGKPRCPVQREVKEVMAELLIKLGEKLEPRMSGMETNEDGGLNRDRLTVGVDLGDQWSNYCILGLEGEKLVEGRLRTEQHEIAEFFQAMAPARVVMEVGTHSAWVREVVLGCGHEVLVANPRQMDGPKRRRKNDRIDAHKLARVTSGSSVVVPDRAPEYRRPT